MNDSSKFDILKKILDGKKAVIFDFDNIVVDSEPCHFEAYSMVFTRKGHSLNREEYWLEWTSKGGGAEGEINRHNLDLDPAEIRREKDPIYAEFCRSGRIRPFPHVIRIINALEAAGYIQAIASGSYESDIRAILSANGIEAIFSAVVGKDTITNFKPHPETYIKAAKKIGIPPGACVAIEDAEKGIKSARGAGMQVIVIETEITSGLELEGADLKLSSLEELSRLLSGVLQ